MAFITCSTLLHNSQQHSSSRTFFSIPSFNSVTCILPNEPHNNHILHLSTFFTKRKLHLTLLLTTFLSSNLSNTSGAFLMAQELDLELHRYTDSKEGFTLLIPSSWTKVDKAGETALFQDASMGSNNIGVVVNPVRLANLGDFRSPEFVADKHLQAERCKVRFLFPLLGLSMTNAKFESSVMILLEESPCTCSITT
ncbi:psbP domain-containing protein 2, chloroplastic-like isoform X1 [Arachis ipaensis]|uniref:psbP domain-containing protein 2, chloroplastic-like isoform X1 n=1 Tax=Arachis ipaensis TaxID=130454 RepID=UPI000A2B2E7B|nr:psbP domain-containing protein 2, chloroplastic-like isoform X1 [Arachis ipaensis]XP_025672204.2 psbP domain-containing protein 2, chloroplastic isoform X1 [Arachis hypogaea]